MQLFLYFPKRYHISPTQMWNSKIPCLGMCIQGTNLYFPKYSIKAVVFLLNLCNLSFVSSFLSNPSWLWIIGNLMQFKIFWHFNSKTWECHDVIFQNKNLSSMFRDVSSSSPWMKYGNLGSMNYFLLQFQL